MNPEQHRDAITDAMLRCCRAYGTTASPGAIAGFEAVLNDLLKLHNACLAHNEMLAALLRMNLPPDESPATRDVLAERRRQIEAEGWTPEHDDSHADDELAAMARDWNLILETATWQNET